jgi:hypothetical protein
MLGLPGINFTEFIYGALKPFIRGAIVGVIVTAHDML